MSLVHHNQPVAVRDGIPHVVRDHQCRQMRLPDDALRRVQHLLRCLRIERRRVLVQQQNLRPLQGRHQQRQRLPLSAGQQPDLRGHPVLQPQLQHAQPLPVLLSLLPGDAPPETAAVAAPRRERQVLIDLHRARRARHRILEHPSDERCPLIIRQPRDILPVDENRAGIDRPHTGHRVQHRRFARAVSADDRDKTSVVQLQADVDQCLLLIDCAQIKGLENMSELQHRSCHRQSASFPDFDASVR